MHDAFVQRLRTAANAAWWTILIGVTLVLVQWVIYMALMAARPAWVLAMCGPDVTWSVVANMALWYIGAFKFCLWMMALAATWLSLWTRRLAAT